MKKKIINEFSKKELLPLSLFFLEAEGEKKNKEKVIKLSKSARIKSNGYVVGAFYKPISKI